MVARQDTATQEGGILQPQSTDDAMQNTEDKSSDKRHRWRWPPLKWLKASPYLLLFSLNLLGAFVLLISTAGKNKKKNERASPGDANDPQDGHHDVQNTENTPNASRWRRSPLFKLLEESKELKQILRPTSFWIPLFVTTGVVFCSFRAVEKRHESFGNVETFRKSCPSGNGRTPEGALVKLLAATVTTIGINGHLGSLAGSESWKRELFRAVEVILSPLTTLYHASSSIWYELVCATSTSSHVWRDDLSIRYRLSRLCNCRVQRPETSIGPYIGDISPRHIEMITLRCGLKWYGRVLFLTILLAQYTQASILLTRRFLSQTAAAIDMAMAFMVISGLVALVQSLIITLISSKWVMKAPFEPCPEKACRFQECIDWRTSQGLPSNKFSFHLFGFSVSTAPRYILHLLAGGHLQLALVMHTEYSLFSFATGLIGVRMFWGAAIYISVTIEAGYNLFNSLMSKDDNDENGNIREQQTQTDAIDPAVEMQEMPSPPEASPAPAPESRPLFPLTKESALMSLLFYIFTFTVGVGFILFGVLCILMHLLYFIFPLVSISVYIMYETLIWGNCDPKKPCPQLWKDNLEDMLWAF